MTEASGDARSLRGEHLIATVETSTCRFPLPEPIVLEHFEIHFREYVIVRVTTTTGLEGVAWALTRGALIAHVIDVVAAPVVVGRDALAIPALLERFERQLALLGTEGLVQRAFSLLDIALWDIKGRAAEMPVWRLLGGYATEVPTLLVDAYPKPGDPMATIVDRIVARVGAGYRALKLSSASDPAVTASLLAAVREAVGPSVDLVVDVAMAWRDPRQGLAAIQLWAPYDPAWIEDPFRAEQVELIRFIRERSTVPIGAGDEVANPLAMQRLIATDAVDVVRLDAACQGGLSGFAKLAALATSRGCPISPHTYPEIHQHCAFALPGIRYLEVFAPQTPYDCTEAFLRPESLVRAIRGVVHAPANPGLGVEINWGAVEEHAVSRA